MIELLVTNPVSGAVVTFTFANIGAALAAAARFEAAGAATQIEDGWDGGGYEPTCSICDALGHGYPGAGPCPLEDSGRFEPEGAF